MGSEMTPGPWIVDENPYYTDEGDKYWMILDLPSNDVGEAIVADRVYCEADARLIAVAPALAAALRAVIDAYAKTGYTGEDDMRAALREARALLAELDA